MGIDRTITPSKIIATIALPELFEQQSENFKGWPSVVNAGKFGWLVYLQGSEKVLLLNESLHPTKVYSINTPSESYVKMSPDGSLLAVVTTHLISIYNVNGEQICQLNFSDWDTFEGGGCEFTDNNLLWFAQASSHPSINDKIVVFDPIAQTILAETTMATSRGYCSFIPSPLGNGMFIEVACGQDGTYLYFAMLNQKTLSISDLQLPFRLLTGKNSFSPNRNYYVTAPHNRQSLQVHNLITNRLVMTVEFSELVNIDNLDRDDENDGFGYFAIFLNDNRILVDTSTSVDYLLIDYQVMNIIGKVVLPTSIGEKTDKATKLRFGDTAQQHTNIKSWICGTDAHRNLLAMTPNRELILYGTESFTSYVDERQLPLFDQLSLF